MAIETNKGDVGGTKFGNEDDEVDLVEELYHARNKIKKLKKMIMKEVKTKDKFEPREN